MEKMDAMPTPRTRQTSVEDHNTKADAYRESEAKRRKVRKGTRSCWECKRRKIKCVFGEQSPIDAICIGCKRRRSKCVSQEFPQEASAPLDNHQMNIGDLVVRAETLIEELIKKVGHDGTAADRRIPGEDGGNPNSAILTPGSSDSEYARFLATLKSSEDDGAIENETLGVGPGLDKIEAAVDTPVGQSKYEGLSRVLHRSLPSREDTEQLLKARSHNSVLFHEVWTTPYNILDQDGLKRPESLLEIPGPDVHPVLIARYMLHLAIFLQHAYSDVPKEINDLPEQPRQIMKRLADSAIGLVTTNDELLGSFEGLECVMMESMYLASGGNLRRSLVALRRAMVIAQLMGLHRSGSQAQYKTLDPKTKVLPQFMWFRIVFYDRGLCLMLGLPQGSLDRSMASDAIMANDTPLGRLERMHCVIASRILERNDTYPSSRDFSLTQNLDMELQRAARSLPSKWWLTPDLINVVNDPQAFFWNMQRVVHHMFHYNLLNQLHLPFMLRSSAEHNYNYSRITCVNASREMISRFIIFRRFNQNVICCRTVDFFALMAAMTLLLAHLDSFRSSQSHTHNLLAHQYLSDRAMMEQVQENMEEVSRLNADALSAQSADLLRRLLAIEAEAEDGHIHSAESVSVQAPDTDMVQPDEDSNTVVRVYIPYFGIIKIAREGVILKEIPNAQSAAGHRQAVGRPRMTGPKTLRAEAAVRSSGIVGPSGAHKSRVIAPVEMGYDCLEESSTMLPVSGTYAETQAQLRGLPALYASDDSDDNSVATQFAPQFPNPASDALLQQSEYPVLTAGLDDWAFQGVDMAFFDSLMRGTEDDGNNGAEWATWQNEH